MTPSHPDNVTTLMTSQDSNLASCMITSLVILKSTLLSSSQASMINLLKWWIDLDETPITSNLKFSNPMLSLTHEPILQRLELFFSYCVQTQRKSKKKTFWGRKAIIVKLNIQYISKRTPGKKKKNLPTVDDF